MGKYRVILSERAKKDLLTIQKSGDKSSIKKIEIIISELYIHPETGTGKPERLKFDLSGYWSRRINRKDRLIYSIEENNNGYHRICSRPLWPKIDTMKTLLSFHL